MRKSMKQFYKIVLFTILICFVISGLQQILNTKLMYDVWNPSTEGIKGFYELKNDTIDALIIGSSHVACGFNPQIIYDTNNLRSYCIGTNSQAVFVSYYWLLETLKYQHPSVVIFDVYSLFGNWGFDESHLRYAFDNMRWGEVKYNAIKDILDLANGHTTLSYFFPFFRYHNRWKEISENDIKMGITEKPPFLKGAWIAHGVAGYEGSHMLSEDIDGGIASVGVTMMLNS